MIDEHMPPHGNAVFRPGTPVIVTWVHPWRTWGYWTLLYRDHPTYVILAPRHHPDGTSHEQAGTPMMVPWRTIDMIATDEGER